MQINTKASFNIAFGLLLAINNAVAFVFLGIAFLSGQPHDRFTPTEFMMRFFTYGLLVSVFFSGITLGLKFIFRKKSVASSLSYLKLFLVQMMILLFVFIIAFIKVYI
jgi:hypothetical protein